MRTDYQVGEDKRKRNELLLRRRGLKGTEE